MNNNFQTRHGMPAAKKKQCKLLVTPQEAERIAWFNSSVDSVILCFAVEDAVEKSDIKKEVLNNLDGITLPDDTFIFNAIFTAGVIQGKREERRRRKRADSQADK